MDEVHDRAADCTRPASRLPEAAPSLTPAAAALAIAVALVWGTNPVAIHEGLKQFPPLGGAALRFLMVAVPLAAFLPRPKVRAAALAAYGLLLGAGLGLNNIAMAAHVTPGLASLLLQVQVVLTIAFELLLERRLPSAGQLLALLLCGAGVLLIGLTQDEATDLPGVLLMTAAATCWAIGNLIVRRTKSVSAAAMMVWSAFFAFLLLAILSLLVEGVPLLAAAIGAADATGWAALFWQAAASSLFGYASWNFLLSRYPASRVAPFALLVPVFGMAASALFIGEVMGAAKIAAGALIVSSLAFALIQRKALEAGSR